MLIIECRPLLKFFIFFKALATSVLGPVERQSMYGYIMYDDGTRLGFFVFACFFKN